MPLFEGGDGSPWDVRFQFLKIIIGIKFGLVDFDCANLVEK